ncbi:MAG: hypothetical protein AAF583_01525 [Pseudomonadota bacterium]
MLRRLRLPGDESQIIGILERLFKNKPPHTVELVVVEDWVRKLQHLPIASIWKAYDDIIERPGQTFRPGLGEFKQSVELHAGLINGLGKSLAEAIRNAEAGA